MCCSIQVRLVCAGVSVLALVMPTFGADDGDNKPTAGKDLGRVVEHAFLKAHDGWSTDEVLLRDDLNDLFLRECRSRLPRVAPSALNWKLLNLRKSGQLGPVVTRRRSDRHDAYQHAAEIAARLIYDRSQLTIDRVLCAPTRREEFDRIASQIAPDVSPYLLRKAALGLRKKRGLRPELVLRVADWDREVRSIRAKQIRADPTTVPRGPGVYILRDRTGYLYIGESGNLRTRVIKHLDDSDRQSLANYLRGQELADDLTVELHVFDPDSPARREVVRRAYESELIRSRKPRFNIRP